MKKYTKEHQQKILKETVNKRPLIKLKFSQDTLFWIKYSPTHTDTHTQILYPFFPKYLIIIILTAFGSSLERLLMMFSRC